MKTFVAKISYADFEKVDIRAGRVISVEPHREARAPAFKLTIDFGEPLGMRRSSAQLTIHYDAASLVGSQVIAVVNFAPKRIAGFQSEVLVLGLADAQGAVVLVRPDHTVPLGARLF